MTDMGFLSLPADVQSAVNGHAAMRLAQTHPCQAFVPDTERGVGSARAPEGMLICYRPDDQKPMCFRGERWCSDRHRKQVESQDG